MRKKYCNPVAKILFYTEKDVIMESLVYEHENDVWKDDPYGNLFY